jgi:hypothetical protein
MSAKRKYLTDPEIQSLASLSSAQLQERLVELGPDETRNLISRLLVSYRLAARVANAAWGFFKAWTKGGGPMSLYEEQLSETLKDYAPTDFPRDQGEIETVIDEAKSLLEDMADLSADECREVVATRIHLHEQLLSTLHRKPPVPRTPV